MLNLVAFPVIIFLYIAKETKKKEAHKNIKSIFGFYLFQFYLRRKVSEDLQENLIC